ncbi:MULTISPECIES: hypothetical protein [unclassified Mesorhizobium]|uniref:hypothetical protein n=1 Tax=unclassified Mesorhizobium TaxID=325217 RepID=UPI003336E279
MIAAIEAGVPLLVEARNLIAGFHSMISKKLADDFEPWIADAGKSLIASFVNGTIRDMPPSAPRSPNHDPTVKQRDRSPSSSL